MKRFCKNKLLIGSFILFVLANIVLYLWINAFHELVPFSQMEYTYTANHYKIDPRITGKSFSLITALGQYDSQWYLKIAEQGYPKHPDKSTFHDKKRMGGLSYNFFPLLPLGIFFINILVKHIEVSSFIFANILLLANFFSLYFVLSRWFSEKVAVKTIFLFFLFPTSIFFRGYYAEGLRLFLFIWFCFGIQEKKFFLAAIAVGLLSITSGIALLFVPYFMLLLITLKKQENISVKKILYCGLFAISPLFCWMLFCFFQTNNPLIFISTRFAWYHPTFPLLHNISLLFLLPWLPFRSLYGSQIDVLFILLTILISYASRKFLPPLVWMTTVMLAFIPLLFQDSISFARFSCVLFPFFAYLGNILKRRYYFFILAMFTVGLLALSLFYVNWYWIE